MNISKLIICLIGVGKSQIECFSILNDIIIKEGLFMLEVTIKKKLYLIIANGLFVLGGGDGTC